MRHGRFIATILAAAATMAVGPTMATAATASVADDSVADFNQGTPGSATKVVAPGSVQLARAMVTEPFDGPGLPANLTATQWAPTAGTAIVDSGALLVRGDLVRQSRLYDPGEVMEFSATFSGDPFQHVGFGTDFGADAPYAIVSTNTGGTILYARTRSAHGTETTTPLSVAAGAPHTFRIEWSATDVKYYVDGTLEATHAIAITDQMSPVVSDAVAADGAGVSVDSLGLLLGTFESRPLDAGDSHAAWSALTATVTGSGVSFETRSGDGASWSAWQAVDPSGAIHSPSARYIQYRAMLTTDLAPSIDRVQIDYTDDNAPDATIDGMQVIGTTARLAFSSPAADLDGFECAVDGGQFAACTSPTELTGLAPGAHTIDVRAVDRAGNRGQAASGSFTIDGPAATSSGGSGAAQAGVATSVVKPDTTAPRVTVVAQSRASKRGTVGVRVGCPATETRCTVTLVLKHGRTTAARTTVTVPGATTVKVTLRLTKAARRQLTRDRRLKVSALITARDAAGNQTATTKRLTLRA